jgi:hypothetical protein
MAATNFSGPVVSANGFVGTVSTSAIGGVMKLPSYAKASVPPAASNPGSIIYVPDAATGATVCYSNGTNWLRVDTSAVLS